MYGANNMTDKLITVLVKRPQDAFISQEFINKNYQSFNYIAPPNLKEAIKEYEIFESILNKYVENIWTLPADELGSMDSIYTHDCVKVTTKGAIYFPMGKKLRQREKESMQIFLTKHGIPTLGIINKEGAKIEGGDIILMDDVALIGLGFRTNLSGFNEFKRMTEGVFKEYISFQLPIAGGEHECLHLMSLISFVDKNTAVIYEEYMPVVFKQYLTSRNIKCITVDKEEYDLLGSNLLCLSPKKVLLIDKAVKLKAKLEQENIEVLTYKGDEISLKGTGGPTCLTCPIYRKN